jgi:hydroxypyruvate reductase
MGAGKAGLAMARAALDKLGSRIHDGLVVIKPGATPHPTTLGPIVIQSGAHPVPDESSVRTGAAMLAFARSCKPDDLVLFLLSGGASSLMTAPRAPLGLDDLKAVTRALLHAGADIVAINAVRKHLDALKGGGLAAAAAPARLISLVLSDVMGDRLDIIGSGPTAPNSSSYGDVIAAASMVESGSIPPAVRALLDDEALSHNAVELGHVTNHILAGNKTAVTAALARARELGFTTFEGPELVGEAHVMGRELAQRFVRLAGARRPVCLVAGGETTVTVRGQGLGGRNQELALGAVETLAGIENVACIAFATDGDDGPTDAAGAVVTGNTLQRARELGLDPRAFLAENNAYRFFEPLGDLLRPGPTGTNVCDIAVLIAWPHSST